MFRRKNASASSAPVLEAAQEDVLSGNTSNAGDDEAAYADASHPLDAFEAGTGEAGQDETHDESATGHGLDPDAGSGEGDGSATVPLELVVQPGSVRRVHFDGADSPQVSEVRASAPVRPSPLSFGVDDLSFGYRGVERTSGIESFRSTRTTVGIAPSIHRRTVYRTESGGEVVAYEGRGRRELALTSAGGLDERRFDSRIVDDLVRNVPLEERRVVRSTVTEYVSDTPVRAVATSEYRLARVSDGPVAGTTIDAWEPGAGPQARLLAVPAADALQYGGDSHPVRDIEGIGPEWSARLQEAGIETTARLAIEDPAALAAAVGAPEKSVRSWTAMSELIKVDGIGKQYAEILARVGVDGIEDLKARVPEKLAQRIDAYLGTLETNPIGTKVTAKRIAGWQKSARKLKRKMMPVPER